MAYHAQATHELQQKALGGGGGNGVPAHNAITFESAPINHRLFINGRSRSSGAIRG